MILISALSLLPALQQSMIPLPPSADPTLVPAGQAAPRILPQATTLLGSSSSAIASLDDFQRPDGDVGPGWETQGFGFQILGNVCRGMLSGNGWIQRSSIQIAAEDAVILIDLDDHPTTLSYGAAVHGAGGLEMAFTKVQSNGSGTYESVGFYHGIGAGQYSGYGGFFPIQPVTGGVMKVYISNQGDTMNVKIDEGRDGFFEWHYQADGLVTSGLSALFGNRVGLGSYTNTPIHGWALNPSEMPQLGMTATSSSATVHLVHITPDAEFTFLLSSQGQTANPQPFGLILVDPRWQTAALQGPSADRWTFHTPIRTGMHGHTLFVQAVETSPSGTRLTNLTTVAIP